MYNIPKLKFSMSLAIAVLISGCASMKPQEVGLSEVPEGIWDEYKVVTSDIRLTNPNLNSSTNYSSGDCPNQKITKKIPGAMCVEARTQDPSRGCNVVTSTFGIGYCPKSYSNDEYGRKTAKIDAVMAAGTAAQNAVLATGQNMSRRMQEEGMKFLQTYEFSTEISSDSVAVSSGNLLIDTVTSEKEYFSTGDLIAYSRYGFYAECFTPSFDAVYKVEMGSWFYRIAKNKPICKVPVDGKNFRPDYINVKSSGSGATFNYPITLNQDNDLFTVAMVDPIFGMKAFSRKGVTAKEISKHTGFVLKKGKSGKLISVSKVSPNSVTLVLSKFEGSSARKTEFILTADGVKTDIDGVKVSLQNLDTALGAQIKIDGKFETLN